MRFKNVGCQEKNFLLQQKYGFGDYYGSYHAIEEAYKEGKFRAMGVSNFYPDRYLDIVHFPKLSRQSIKKKPMCFSSRGKRRSIWKIRCAYHVMGTFCRGKK